VAHLDSNRPHPDSSALEGLGDHEGTRARPALDAVPFLDVVLNRRSRRFALGNVMEGGPLAHKSATRAVPLSKEEEALLAFAGAGINGYALAELPYEPSAKRTESGGGNVMYSALGRTIASPDAHHNVILFVVNDSGGYMMKRPQDFPKSEIEELTLLAKKRDFVPLYERCRVRLTDKRPGPPREVPFVLPFNKWSANLPGTTYFVPVNELSSFYINALFAVFSEEFGYYIVDEQNGYAPAGVAKFARSRGGHLFDDAHDGRVITVQYLEAYILEMCALEQGLMLQNLQLMTEALGLGGFPHYAGHHYGWLEALGFRMEHWPISRLMRKGRAMDRIMTALGKNPKVPQAIGLEKDGHTLIRPYCPPYYASMRDAVRAMLDFKFSSAHGTFRDGGSATAWRDGKAVQARIPAYSDANVEAVIAYLEYVWERYGRILANFGTFRTLLGYQAHHLDLEFYDRFYKKGAYTDAHVHHFDRWHARPSE
jgi:hypothetical protein